MISEKYFPNGVNLAARPTIQDISETKKWLGFKPRYSLMNLLEDLSKYGEAGSSTIDPD